MYIYFYRNIQIEMKKRFLKKNTNSNITLFSSILKRTCLQSYILKYILKKSLVSPL